MIWMEVRCAKMDAELCVSAKNNGPMRPARDTQYGVVSTFKKLATEAEKSGWRWTLEGYVCPVCLAESRGIEPRTPGGATG